MMGTLLVDQYIYFIYYPTQFFLEWEIFKRSCKENRNTYSINSGYLRVQTHTQNM
jgi:hypothetical protein